MNNLPNVQFKQQNKNPIIDSDTSLYILPFYKDTEYFSNLDNFVRFVKSVESLVRTSKYYSRYISYIKNDVGLNFCQVLSNIKHEDEEDLTLDIEMHHGPILTLFDYICILVDWSLYNNKKITTFSIANKMLEEHFENRVQVVMLSKTVHEEVHENNIFLNTKHAFGDLNAFLEKYKDGISQEQIDKINKYITLCEKYDSFDKGTLNLRENIKKWGDT